MTTITTIGVDLAKNNFSVYSVNAKGKPILSRTLSRAVTAGGVIVSLHTSGVIRSSSCVRM